MGAVNLQGKEVIPVIYDDLQGLDENGAFVELSGKWGIINTAGKIVKPITYDSF